MSNSYHISVDIRQECHAFVSAEDNANLSVVGCIAKLSGAKIGALWPLTSPEI